MLFNVVSFMELVTRKKNAEETSSMQTNERFCWEFVWIRKINDEVLAKNPIFNLFNFFLANNAIDPPNIRNGT